MLKVKRNIKGEDKVMKNEEGIGKKSFVCCSSENVNPIVMLYFTSPNISLLIIMIIFMFNFHE